MLKNENYNQFVNLMLDDLMHEKKHMLFYLTAASTVSGLHREEYRELFQEEAASEMQHVLEFQNALLGLGADLCACTQIESNHTYIVSYDVEELLRYALKMEEDVVLNYTNRILNDIQLLDEPDKRFMEIFYEKQIEKSRGDIDNYRMILRSMNR